MSLSARIRKKRSLQRRVFESQNHRCAYCHRRPQELTLDHVIPVSKGGQDDFDNLIGACAKCNRTRDTIDAFVYYRILHTIIDNPTDCKNLIRVSCPALFPKWSTVLGMARRIEGVNNAQLLENIA